mgnify:CR=1 FL=1
MSDIEIIDWWEASRKHDSSAFVEQADQETQLVRYERCIMCPDLQGIFICKHCGCFMPHSFKAKDHKCPLGKW